MSDFLNTLRTHIFIEVYFKRRGLALVESKLDKTNLYETYGLNIEVERLADLLISSINKYQLQNGKLLKIHSNVTFVDEAIVYITNAKSVDAAYWPEKTVVDNNGKFKQIVIILNPDFLNNDNIKPALLHELTHVYQDYNLRLKGKNLYQRMDKVSNYGKLTSEFLKSEDYHERYLSKILYLLNGYEKGAYISELKGMLLNKDFLEINDVVDFIKNSVTFQNFDKVCSMAEQIAQRSDDAYLDAVNKITGLDFKTYNQFSKWLMRKVYKVRRKLERIIPKIASDYANMVEIMPQIRNFDFND